MSSSSALFNGTSRYSSDFQQVIDRAVAIRSLSLGNLNNIKKQIGNQSAALTSLDTVFTSLQTAVQGINNSTGIASLSASVSNAAIARANLATGALQGTYSIEVTGLGAFTNTLSKNGLTPVSDPTTQNINSASSFTLVVNSTTSTITPAANNLNSLVAAINANSALNVRASIVNIGPSGTPDYRLSLQSTKLSADSIQLSAGATPLLDTLSTGSLATYKVNGLATSITSDSRTVTLAPGLTVDLLAQSAPGDATTITVSRSTTSISNALSAFANAYNAAVTEIDKHRGSKSGALAGQSILSTLSQSLRNISSYSSGVGALSAFTSLGFSFDRSGVLSFDSAAFASATTGNISGLYSFLGDSTTGFIKSVNDVLNTLEDTTSGTIKTTLTSLTSQATNQDTLIAAEQARIDQFRGDLTGRIAAADALIATLEQQVTFITGLFQAQNPFFNQNR